MLFNSANDQLKVKIKSGSYFVSWTLEDAKFQEQIQIRVRKLRASSNILIINTVMMSLYAYKIKEWFVNFHVIVLPDGEKQKDFLVIHDLLKRFMALNVDRTSCVWALGGGVIGDLSGFAASIYMRGIRVIQIPTTFLAMLDSSVGGKTGVNFKKQKNSIGTFYQPSHVYIHIPFLTTLPMRELYSGLVELIKMSIILDEKLFEDIYRMRSSIFQKDLEVLRRFSYDGVKNKAKIVSADEKEKGLRAILNFGHTLGHAIEDYFNYGDILHGEAVSFGISFATYFSWKKNYINENVYNQILSILKQFNLPTNITELPIKNKKLKKMCASDLVSLIEKDKKNISSDIHFIFIKKIGVYKLPESVSKSELLNVLESFLNIK